jgi:hypothetical protein
MANEYWVSICAHHNDPNNITKDLPWNLDVIIHLLDNASVSSLTSCTDPISTYSPLYSLPTDQQHLPIATYTDNTLLPPPIDEKVGQRGIIRPEDGSCKFFKPKPKAAMEDPSS